MDFIGDYAPRIQWKAILSTPAMRSSGLLGPNQLELDCMSKQKVGH